MHKRKKNWQINCIFQTCLSVVSTQYHTSKCNAIHPNVTLFIYGVATISRLLQIAGLFCKRALKCRRYSAKETYYSKEPTHCSHTIHLNPHCSHPIHLNPCIFWVRIMVWLRLVGSLRLQVSFAEHRLFYRALLQKKPIILRSLLIVAAPYLCSALLEYMNVSKNM